jgi:hypothetical protein
VLSALRSPVPCQHYLFPAPSSPPGLNVRSRRAFRQISETESGGIPVEKRHRWAGEGHWTVGFPLCGRLDSGECSHQPHHRHSPLASLLLWDPAGTCVIYSLPLLPWPRRVDAAFAFYPPDPLPLPLQSPRLAGFVIRCISGFLSRRLSSCPLPPLTDNRVPICLVCSRPRAGQGRLLRLQPAQHDGAHAHLRSHRLELRLRLVLRHSVFPPCGPKRGGCGASARYRRQRCSHRRLYRCVLASALLVERQAAIWPG